MEDKSDHEPEWRELERGYGQEINSLRSVQWDPVNDAVRSTGPVVVNKPPHAKAP